MSLAYHVVLIRLVVAGAGGEERADDDDASVRSGRAGRRD